MLRLAIVTQDTHTLALSAGKRRYYKPVGKRDVCDDFNRYAFKTSCFFTSCDVFIVILQGLATQVVTNLISHDSSMVEEFLSKHDDVVASIVDLLQFSPW